MTVAAETRTFKMHPKLLVDVIKRQAGSIEKAVLEAVMNAIEAGSTFVKITVDPRRIQIEDDGKGFANRKEIENFFETFGQPHDASEGKKWAQFRMGRGQMFAFGINHWVTGKFRMLVDINGKGLDYDLHVDQASVKGCKIVIDLYEGLVPRAIAVVKSEIERYVKYVEVPVTVNEVEVNSSPSECKFLKETEDGYFNLSDAHQLQIYNMGVFVCSMGKHVYGCGGTIVSKNRLDVNFARNDIIRSCPEWRKIVKEIELYSPKVRKKTKLDDQERANLIERVLAGEIPYDEFMSMPLFVDVSGHAWTATKIGKSEFKTYSVADEGNRIGDKLMQSGIALVLDKAVTALWGCKANVLFEKTFEFKGLKSRLIYGQKKFEAIEVIGKSINDKFFIVSKDNWTKGQAIWVRVLEKMNSMASNMTGQKSRPILIGESQTANAWTNGSSYIAFNTDFLNREKLVKNGCPNLCSLIEVAEVLLHEYCHDDDSTMTMVHSPEFYKAHHDANLGLAVAKNWNYIPTLGMMISTVFGWLTPKMLDSLYGGKIEETEETPMVKNEDQLLVAAVSTIEETPIVEVEPKKAPKTPKVKVISTGFRMAKDVTDPAEIEAIKKARADGKTYDEIEAEFNLKPTSGMTAYRIINPKKEVN